MKIAFFIQNFSRSGGSERVTSLIANFLKKQGHDVIVISICGDNTCFYSLESSIQMITLINKQEINNRKDFFNVLKALDKFYLGNHIDLVIDVFAALSIYTLLLKRKYHYKNITWEHFNFHVNTGMNKIGRIMAIKCSDAIITLTNEDRGFYCTKYPRAAKKIYAIYNPTPYPNAIVGLQKDKLVLSVGRLTKQKDFITMLDIWKIVQKDYPEWKLLILGTGEEREKLEHKIGSEKIKNVELPGAVNNVDKYYQKASIYWSTSLYEGLPMTMIEAQSFGLPIVSFNYKTGPSEIIENGRSGYIIDKSNNSSANNKAMARAIIELISNSNIREKYANEAKIESNRFTMEQIGKCWIKLLQEI